MAADNWNIKLLEPSFSPWQPEKEPAKQIAVLMSGGLDSSVTALLLKEAGWEVLGIIMKIPVLCNTGKRGCCAADAALNVHFLPKMHGRFILVQREFDKSTSLLSN